MTQFYFRYLNNGGISIPCKYTSFIAPISCSNVYSKVFFLSYLLLILIEKYIKKKIK